MRILYFFVGIVVLSGILMISAYIYKVYQKARKTPTKLEDVKNRRDFEIFVSVRMQNTKGFQKVQLGTGRNDKGIDVIGRKDGKKYIVQCKFYKERIPPSFIRELAYVVGGNKGAIAVVNGLTSGARKLAMDLGFEIWEFQK